MLGDLFSALSMLMDIAFREGDMERAEKVLPGLLTEMKTEEEYSFLWEDEEFQELIRTYDKRPE